VRGVHTVAVAVAGTDGVLPGPEVVRAFLLRQPTPDAVTLLPLQGMLAAHPQHRATAADRFRLHHTAPPILTALILRVKESAALHTLARSPSLPLPTVFHRTRKPTKTRHDAPPTMNCCTLELASTPWSGASATSR